MGVDDRMRIGQFAVEQAVLDKARLVDVPWIVGVDLVAVDVDLDKARRGDLAEMHAVRVDEVAAVLVGNLHRDMVEDHLVPRSEEHTSDLQSLMRISYAVFCLKK